MKIEVGKTYVNKVTKGKVLVNSIENNKVNFVEVGRPGHYSTRSVRDLALKYKQV